MDILGNQKMRRIVTNYYEESGEQKLVSKAVVTAWEKEKLYNDTTTETDGTLPAKLKAVRSAHEKFDCHHVIRYHTYNYVYQQLLKFTLYVC